MGIDNGFSGFWNLVWAPCRVFDEFSFFQCSCGCVRCFQKTGRDQGASHVWSLVCPAILAMLLCLFIFLMFYDCFQFACLFFYVLNVSHVFAKFSDVFLDIGSCMVSLVVFYCFFYFFMDWRRTINRGTDLSWTVKIILYSIYLFWGWTALVRCSYNIFGWRAPI